jgi:hypothetical protein
MLTQNMLLGWLRVKVFDLGCMTLLCGYAILYTDHIVTYSTKVQVGGRFSVCTDPAPVLG